MGKPKASIMWKTSDRRVKQSKIWDSWLQVRGTYMGYLGLVMFNVIWGSFDALHTILSKRCFFYTHDSFSTKLFTAVPSNSLHSSCFLGF